MGARAVTPGAGVWVAYYSDMSSLVLFDDELACLRYAVENHMQAKYMQYGQPVREQMESGCDSHPSEREERMRVGDPLEVTG